MNDVEQNSESPRRSTWPTCLTVSAIITLLCVFAGMYVFRYDDGENKTDLARAGTKTLEIGVISYRQKFGEYPRKLDELVNPPDGPPFVEPSAILDQWSRPYQYDPTGPRNQGRKPDIWTIGHDGKPIGNWPEPRHWWDW